jgi:hypothetical protein
MKGRCGGRGGLVEKEFNTKACGLRDCPVQWLISPLPSQSLSISGRKVEQSIGEFANHESTASIAAGFKYDFRNIAAIQYLSSISNRIRQLECLQ